MSDKCIKIFLLTIAILLFIPASASHAVSLTSLADVTILRPITIAENAQLNFGTIQTPTNPTETVIVNTDGTPGNGTATFIDSSAVAAGNFTVTSSTVSISLAASDAGGAADMFFADFRGSYDGGNDRNLGAGMNETGNPSGAILLVGATLRVSNTVVGGTYSPSFDIDVNYE